MTSDPTQPVVGMSTSVRHTCVTRSVMQQGRIMLVHDN